MWPLKRKPAWEVVYAQNIYDGLVAHNEFGDITALTIRIPMVLHQAYQNKILLQRELIAFVAVMENGDSDLQKVMLAFGDLLVLKCAGRGLQLTRDQLAEYALIDVGKMLTKSFPWAQEWLAEFREANDNYMAALFADHCLRLHHGYTTGIEKMRPS